MQTTTIVPFDPLFADPERLALAGFLAGYSGQTLDAYGLDLRQFLTFCHEHGLELLKVRRADIEIYARTLEARGRARATIARRLSTVAGFYRYAEDEGLIDHSPAVHVRRPRGRVQLLLVDPAFASGEHEVCPPTAWQDGSPVRVHL